jgi:hypothetical protein
MITAFTILGCSNKLYVHKIELLSCSKKKWRCCLKTDLKGAGQLLVLQGIQTSCSAFLTHATRGNSIGCCAEEHTEPHCQMALYNYFL